MTEPQHQALSALLDGELDAEQADALLEVVARDETLAAAWHRMHRMRDLLRGDVEPGLDIREGVRGALADEPTYFLPAVAPAPRLTRWSRYAVGGALAASVALVTVVGLRQWQAADSGPELASADARSTAAVAYSETPERAVDRLHGYWSVHADNALLAGQDAFAGPVRSVSADAAQ
ncbi:MAG TPA: hypothetical protein DIT63_04295 [Gammaproteobacteria bacterium]|nr:hypothetical protein [Gammaproteobacteria bacterium]